jgi:hypothetical protein
VTATRKNYYKDLLADYSRPHLVSPELGQTLLREAEKYIARREDTLPEITPTYTLAQIEKTRSGGLHTAKLYARDAVICSRKNMPATLSISAPTALFMAAMPGLPEKQTGGRFLLSRV